MTIHFYKQNEEYGYLSNFSHYGFVLDGLYWPTSEHYFQAQKFLDRSLGESIRQADSPMDAARMGRNRDWPLRKDWDSVRCDVMRRGLLAKFSQNHDILERLLSTAGEALIEDTKDDYYWGCGNDGTGDNNLGKILMQVRGMLG